MEQNVEQKVMGTFQTNARAKGHCRTKMKNKMCGTNMYGKVQNKKCRTKICVTGYQSWSKTFFMNILSICGMWHQNYGLK